MATTILNAFREYRSNLEITDKQTTLVSTRRNNVVSAIEQVITLHQQPSYLIGSYDRNTLIRYLSEGDVDVMVVLHYGDNKSWDTDEGTIKVLTKFKSILDAAFPSVEKRIDRNCVSMKYYEYTLDIVPAFAIDNGSFVIPDTIRQKWLPTNPIAFAERISAVNKNMNGSFIPLIKMIKGWNREKGFPLKSFHLECLMYDRYKTYTQAYTYSSMISLFFQNLESYLSNASFDPVTGDRVDTYLDNYGQVSRRQKAIQLARTAAKESSIALVDEEKNPSIAIGEWKDLLGTFFPDYG